MLTEPAPPTLLFAGCTWQKPSIPDDDDLRVAALHSFRILDTGPTSQFDRIVDQAALLMNVPIALISLVDQRRQWFKARVGLELRELPRDQAFCAHAILGTTAMVVEDTHADPRFAAHPLVLGDPNMRFYVGIPLIATGGARLGTLCAIDRQPRVPSAVQLARLGALAQRTMLLLEVHKLVSDIGRWADPMPAAC